MDKDIFEGLRKQLEILEWPSVYFFKFICPAEDETIAKIVGLFDPDSDINFQPSKNGKYTSVSIKEVMMNAESIINVYKSAGEIKGVMSL